MMQIPKRNLNCTADGKKWEPGTDYVSLIYEHEGSWQREDYCFHCWKQVAKEKKLPGSYFFWRGRTLLKKDNTSPKFALTSIELLKELSISESDQKLFYLLALYLDRKKVIVKRQEVRNKNRHQIVYEFPQTEEVFAVNVVSISEEEIRRLYEEIMLRLNHQ